MSDNIKDFHKDLFEIILKLNTIDECVDFFNDLCTYKEIDSMASRIQAAKMLTEGKTFAQISKQMDISSATLSRVSKALRYGKGYKKLL